MSITGEQGERYEDRMLEKLREAVENEDRINFNRLKELLAEQIRWTNVIDPDLAKAGNDCIVRVPQKPAWDRKLIGEPLDHYRLHFKVPNGEKPLMGREKSYIIIKPMDPVADMFYSAKEGVRKYLKNTVLPFFNRRYAIRIR